MAAAGFVPTRHDGYFALDLTVTADPTPEWIKVRERSVV